MCRQWLDYEGLTEARPQYTDEDWEYEWSEYQEQTGRDTSSDSNSEED